MFEVCRGEGSGFAMGATEASWTWLDELSQHVGAKQHGMQPPRCDSTTIRLSAASKVVKRSLQRAARRASSQGMAWYRGRALTSADFARMGCSVAAPSQLLPSPPDALTRCNGHHSPRRRLSCWMWNCGGLAQAKLDEIKTWLEMHRIDIAVLVESRWTFDSEWSDTTWNLIHSGAGSHRGKGILVLIRKDLCPSSCLFWQHYEPGRLLHLRLLLKGRPMDLLACYQHTYTSTKECLQDRERWWGLLETVLHSLPKRNSLVLLGDFNCSVDYSPSIIGTSSFKWNGVLTQGSCHQDSGRFMGILRFFGLVVLNSWSSALGPTYKQHNAVSRIDYICVRKHQADGVSRQVQYLWQSPFLSSNSAGHVPMMCTLAKYWIPSNHDVTTHGVSLHQRKVCRQEYSVQSAKWQLFSEQSAGDIQRAFAQASRADRCPLTCMHESLLKRFHQFFSASRTVSKLEPWREVKHLTLNMWDHRRLMTRAGLCTMRNVLHGWFHAIRFLALKRRHRRAAVLVRQANFRDIVSSAQIAAEMHDTHQLFSIINRFSPKQPRRKVQLRNSDGMMATSLESAALLQQYVATTWEGPSTLGLEFDRPPGVPFTESQLLRALESIPMSKAVACPFAPGLVVRDQAHVLAPLLFQQISFWWNQNPPFIPSEWKDGWLCFIPKMQKAPVRPQNLRPLALQDGVGKAVIGLVIQLALRAAWPRVVSWPLFGYLQFRSTQDAIRRVITHCLAVRQLICSQRATPHQRASGLGGSGRMVICGGLQLLVDLNRAFDSVNRNKLFARLHILDIPDSIIHLLCAWHEQTSYHVQTDHGFQPVMIGRGVRQGCKAAPTLFNFFMVVFLTDLCQVLPAEWICSHLTLYADDCHIGGTFCNSSDFERLRTAFGVLFSTLRSLDMTINPDKSVAILAMAGSSYRTFRSRCVQRDQQGEKLRIEMLSGETVLIPLQPCAKYLGVVISYGCFEDASLRHRLTLMQVGFQRLKRWLTGKHSLSVAQRFQMWRCCVFPILTYGTFAVGVTVKGVSKLLTTLTSMLRKVMGDHSYLTRNSNAHAFHIHHIPSPATLLHGAVAGLWTSVTQRTGHVIPEDIVLTVSWDHLPDLMRQFSHAQATVSLERSFQAVSEAKSHGGLLQCSMCAFTTTDIPHFRRHCTQVHGQSMHCTRVSSIQDFFVDGLPQCKHCGLAFTTWRLFRAHITRGCQVLLRGPEACLRPSAQFQGDLLGTLVPTMNAADSAAVRSTRILTQTDLEHVQNLSFGNRLLCLIQDSDWHLVKRDAEICEYLSRKCVLCGFTFGRTQELHQHYRQVHPECWELAPQKGILLTNLYARDSPCEYCGSLFRTHQCVVWSQIAVLLVNGAHLLALHEVAPADVPRHRCDICLSIFEDVAQLTQHLQKVHNLQGLAFNEGRDAIEGNPACAHCGTLFLSMTGLKSHIVQGKCPEFNPQATAETCPIDPLWRAACLEGKMLEVLKPPANRMRLTIRCQQCGKGCQRAADLALHLQSCHSRLWKWSQRLIAVMVEVYYSTGQCVCNPMTGVKRLNHICLPFRQLAMSFHRLRQEPFAPMVITDSMLASILSNRLDSVKRFKLERLLSTRSFAELWQDADLMQLMRSCCLFCGSAYTAADLALHLREAHPCGHVTTLFYMEQLMSFLIHAQQVDYQCRLCLQIYNLPADQQPDISLEQRQTVAVSHLKGCCPNLLQISLLLALLLRGNGLSDGTQGADGPDAGARDVSVSRPLAGQGPPAGPKSKGLKTPAHGGYKRARVSQGRGPSAGRPDGAASSASDSTGAAPRPGTQHSTKDGSIHLFFEPRSDRSIATPDSGHHNLADEDGEYILLAHSAASAPTPGLGDAASSANPSVATGGEPRDGAALPDVAAKGCDSGGQELSVSQVGSSAATACAGQEATDQRCQDGAALGRAPGDVAGSVVDTEVPLSQTALQLGLEDHPMANAIAHEERQTIRADASPLLQLGVDAGGGLLEATHLVTERPGNDFADSSPPPEGTRQGTGQGEVRQEDLTLTLIQRLAEGLCGMQLRNEQNWCYANSTILCLLWALLSLLPVHLTNWGQRSTALLDFLGRAAFKTVALIDEPWFEEILRSWGQPLGQNDSAEFSHAMLAWLDSPAVDMRWERRCDIGAVVSTLDQGHQHMPIKLEISLTMDSCGSCTLSSLVRAWCQVDALRAALSSASPCLCLQIDRFVQNEAGLIWRTCCQIDFEAAVTFPFFTTSGLQTETADYVVMAGACHMGADLAGHCRSFLKLRPGVDAFNKPFQWLLTDDDCPAERVWSIPTWMSRNLTVLWLLRADCLHLCSSIGTAADSGAIDSQTALLSLLNSQPGVQLV